VVALVVAIAASRCTNTSTTSTDPSPVKCQVSLANSISSLDASGGTGTVTVTTQQECAWNAAADASWITFVSSASGQGNGKVDFSVAANPGSGTRHGSITINGQKVPVDQAGTSTSCTTNVAPSGLTVAATGGTGSASVSVAAGCAWTAVSNADWITITSGASGTGDGTVGFTVVASSGGARTGTLTIAGQTFTVTQTASPPPNCTFVVAPTSQSVAASGGPVTVTISAGSTCPWSATSNASWLTITSGASGTGDGTVSVTVASNSGPQRTGTVTIAGQTFMVTQSQASGGCTYSVSPTTENIGSAGGAGTPVNVPAPGGCSWTTSSSTSWITNVVPPSGTGSGQVNFTVAGNTSDAQRTGTLIVAGQTVTVIEAGCTYQIAPTSASVGSGAGAGPAVTVTPSASTCPWNASSSDSWITGVTPSGTGTGQVTYNVQANSGLARTGHITIAGQTFTLMQASGCTYGISPSSQGGFSPTGGPGNPVNVTAGGGCTWAATSNAPTWLTVTPPGSGTGNGSFTFSAGMNNSCGDRSGTITVVTQTFTASQDGHSFSPSSDAVPKAGGAGRTVMVTTGSNCTWTAVFDGTPSWIRVTAGGGPNTGNHQVTYSVDPNPLTTSRMATITLGGHRFTVTQSGT
jgi:hypothetical protein